MRGVVRSRWMSLVSGAVVSGAVVSGAVVSGALVGCGARSEERSPVRGNIGTPVADPVSPSPQPAIALNAAAPAQDPAAATTLAPVSPAAGGDPEAWSQAAKAGPQLVDPNVQQDETAQKLVVEPTSSVSVEYLPDTGEGPMRVVGFTVTAASFTTENPDSCAVWLDMPGSELVESDIVVSAEGSQWLADPSCTTDLAWYLSFDTQGAWLELCPTACQLVRSDPTVVVLIEAMFRGGPSRQVK